MPLSMWPHAIGHLVVVVHHLTTSFSPPLCLQDSIGLLLDAVKMSNEELAQTWKKSEQWATIEQLCSKMSCSWF